MELIVAVYDDWGIGRDGTQPIALTADRKFFRETTRGAMVIVGRRTIADFPGQKPLPGRVNVALSRNADEIPGFTLCRSPEEAAQLAKTAERAFVIGGGSTYYYKDLVRVKGFTKIGEDYYFFNAGSGKMFVNTSLWVGANDYGIPQGYYKFGADGKMLKN